jgi:hypothetical protein
MADILEINQDISSFATASTAFDAINLSKSIGFCFMPQVTVMAPATGTFTAAVSDICTKTAHGFLTGLKVRVSNSGGALPTGLLAATDYFVIYLGENTFKLATTEANARAGTAIDITGAGTGTQTVTPTALAGASVKLQVSNDAVSWQDLSGSSNNITVTANFMLNVVDPMYKWVRVVYTLTAGQLSVINQTVVKV